MAIFCLQLNAGVAPNLAMASAGDSVKPKSTSSIERVDLPDKVKNSRILILGGTGRVGGSTAIALSNFCPDLRIVIGGRNRYFFMILICGPFLYNELPEIIS